MIDLKRFDPTDANAGAEAAERANRLEKIIVEYLTWIDDTHDRDPLDALREFKRKFKAAVASRCPSRLES